MENENFELFEAYISKTLTVEEQQAFRDKLNNDLNLNEEFNSYKETYLFLEQQIKYKAQNNDFIKTLKQADTIHFENSNREIPVSSVIRIKPWMYVAAASVVLLFGILLTRNTVPTYDQYVTYEDLDLQVRSSEEETIVKAEESFNSRKFSDALIFINKALNTYPSNNELLLYKAISLLEVGNYKEADIIFEELSKGYSVFKNKALWWAALGKLKQKDYKACEKLLQSIPKEAEDYELAQKLMKKL